MINQQDRSLCERAFLTLKRRGGMHGSQLNTVSRVHHTNSRAGVKNMPSVWKLLLAAALAVGVAGSAHADTEDGVRKWRVGDFAGAVAAWRGPATAGKSDAQFNLGQDRKSGVLGQSVSVRVELGGRRIIKKKTTPDIHIRPAANIARPKCRTKHK